jgi:GAF domain-containing protein
MREGVPIGAILIRRTTVQPFTAKQIALLQTFADQAVIAIENVRLFTELQEKNRALTQAHAQVTESLEQQTATAEILQVISSSPTELQAVFDTIVANAVRLCGAAFGGLQRLAGDRMTLNAQYGVPPDELAILQRDVFPLPVSRDSATGRAILDRVATHVRDIREDPNFRTPHLQSMQSYRTILAVPMLREGLPIGALALWRRDVQPFTEREIRIVRTFADQAVIAIENVRLFNELQSSNRELATALGQQTATGDILKVISRSQTDVQPVFDAIADSALRLCEAKHGNVFLFDGELVHLAAVAGTDRKGTEAVRRSFPQTPGPASATTRAILTRRPVMIPDVFEDPEFRLTEMVRVAAFRGVMSIPMLRAGHPIGAITVTRAEAGPFSDTQLALLQTFADQAVIAIENARLFNETKEALEQQTATAQILRVISSSPTDIQPVLDAVTATAARVCGATDALIMRVEGQGLRRVAHFGPIPLVLPAVRPLTAGSASGRAIVEGRTIHIHDILATDAAREYPDLPADAGAQWRTMLAVPLVREGAAIGAILIRRTETRPFTAKQIQLLETFASQAVIAIENVRLFKELEARTGELSRSVDKLTALGEVGRAVSSTLDLETVLTTIVSRAVELSGLDGGVVFEYDEDDQEFVQRAQAETGGALAAARRGTRIRKGEGVVGRTASILEPVQVLDITLPGAYVGPNRKNLMESGVRAILAVPMVREGQLIGCLAVTRNQPGEFPTETIELLRTFATQSALAIQNARLFQEIEDKSRELEVASHHKSEFLANMSHELRTPLNAIIGFSEVLLERMFGDLNEKQAEYLKDIYASGQHLLSLINDILDLSKIEAGRMELELTEFDLPTAIENALTLVRERAGRRGIALGFTVDERLGQIRADERKIRQVVLNLLSNAIKFTPEGGRIEVRAVPVNGAVEVWVTDTGVGIAPEDQEAIFEEFKQVGTAAKKVEGTGLGLALSRKFIELHGGRIWVESQVEAGSTFTFTIPMSSDA